MRELLLQFSFYLGGKDSARNIWIIVNMRTLFIKRRENRQGWSAGKNDKMRAVLAQSYENDKSILREAHAYMKV